LCPRTHDSELRRTFQRLYEGSFENPSDGWDRGTSATSGISDLFRAGLFDERVGGVAADQVGVMFAVFPF
jgi:hypothetical protein